MIKSRGNRVVVKSQFNIHGSRGRSVKPFITDYVSRDSACDTSLGYISPTGVIEHGDGVAFTFDSSSISRVETLRIADRVEDYFQEGDRAIQQLVISFSHDYLVEQGIVDASVSIIKRGDYRFQYDDIRLRHAIMRGVRSMADFENYHDPQMIAAIQHDTLHLHAHVVVYENFPDYARKRGSEEKGVIKPSSFNQLTHDLDRHLSLTKSKNVPNELKLIPKRDVAPMLLPSEKPVVDMSMWSRYLVVYEELERQREDDERQREIKERERLQTSIDLDKFLDDFYNNQTDVYQ